MNRRGHPDEMAQLARELGVNPLPSHVVAPRTGAVLGRPIVQQVTGRPVLGPGSVGLSQRREADIMSRLPDADIVGVRGPGVVPGGEPRQGARRQAEEAAPVVPTHRPLAGAQQNNRGGSVVVQVNGARAQQPNAVTSIVEAPRNAGDDAELVSVSLGMRWSPDLTDTADTRLNTTWNARAVIEWGIGGASYEAECDWLYGTRFEVLASYVRVGVRFPLIIMSSDPFDLVFSAALGYGPASFRKPQLTVPLTTYPAPAQLAPGADATILIPEFADSFTIVGFSVAAPNLRCLVEGSKFTYTDPSNVGRHEPQTFPIPNGARRLQVINDAAATYSNPQVVFGLSL